MVGSWFNKNLPICAYLILLYSFNVWITKRENDQKDGAKISSVGNEIALRVTNVWDS